MMTCELAAPTGIPALVNLDRLERQQRAAAWHRSARTYFPGLSVNDLGMDPAFGAIAGSQFGAGGLWTILSPPLQVNYDPQGATPERVELFSLMLQLTGATLTRQSNRTALLRSGDMCVIDSRAPFELTVGGELSHIIVIQMPRYAVLSRNPHLERRTAETFDSGESGCVLLRNLLMNVLECAAAMRADQRSASLNAIIHLLGAPRLNEDVTDSPAWRVRAALTYIDAHLADSDLNAARIASAQGVSRRRLDALMVSSTGASVTSHIWSRRLDQAANDLMDERFATGTVTQVAFAAGFEDVAHFTRAFKKRFRAPPSKWRAENRKKQGLEAVPVAAATPRRRN